MGKTAIAEYLTSQTEPGIFSEKLSFKNFPFNVLYSLDDKKYTSPNQYISIWKYLIYSSVCKMMAKNEAINLSIRTLLDRLYIKEPVKTLKRSIEKWTADSFGLEIFGVGGSVGGLRKNIHEISWIEKSDALEDLISENIDNSKYYIVFDELDEDYRDFENEHQKKTYVFLLTSLFKAVQDVRAFFKDSSVNIYPIVLLRSDIYALIHDSDKNKWSDFRIDLSWTPDRLKDMLSY